MSDSLTLLDSHSESRTRQNRTTRGGLCDSQVGDVTPVFSMGAPRLEVDLGHVGIKTGGPRVSMGESQAARATDSLNKQAAHV